MEIQSYVFLDIETTGLHNANMTEISMVAYRRKDLLKATRDDPFPRIMSKLLFQMNPNRNIEKVAQNISGLSDTMLSDMKPLDLNTGNLIKSFLNQQNEPICMVAHNGCNFDFNILRRQLSEIRIELDRDIVYADTLDFFRKIDVGARKHSLIEVYKRRYGREPVTSHHAESDVENLIKCVVASKEEFLSYTSSMENLISYRESY